MPKTKFQSESLRWERPARIIPSLSGAGRFSRSETILSGHSSDRSITATIEPMFLGLLLRGWITEREQQFLDDLVPSRSLSFLISDGNYVHPAVVELFPHELIESSIEQRNPAIFTHLCPPADRSKNGSYRISTFLVNPDESRLIVFGIFGPDYELSTAAFEGKFLGMTDCLRSGFKTARKAESAIIKKDAQEKPTITINRASGRVIAVNRKAVDHYGVPERTLVDKELGETATLLQGPMKGTKRRFENITCNGLSLALVSTTVLQDSKLSESELTRFLTGEIESRVTLLLDTRADLDTGTSPYPHTVLTNPARCSENIVTQIKHDLEKINLLASSSSQETYQTNILWELDRAVDTVSKSSGRPREIQIKNRCSGLELRAPRMLLANLFETILMAHQICSSKSIRTEIHVLRSQDSNSVCIKMKSRFVQSQENVRYDEYWIACAELLARQAGVSIEHPSKGHGSASVTTVTIDQNKVLLT